MNKSVNSKRAFIALLSDFGLRDGYVAAMKAVMLRINPSLQFVDISHEITPAAVEEAAFVLKNVYHYFPMYTAFVAIVDPTVGSNRKILVVETSEYCFFAPDNGLLKWIFAENPECKVFSVENERYFLRPTSRTFHGRDIFAPCAAYWSLGMPAHEFGPECKSYFKPEIRLPHIEKDGITGEVIYIDRFGNCITNIHEKDLGERIVAKVICAGVTYHGLASTYADVAKGESLCLVGSHGFLEIAVREGTAAQKWNISSGEKVKVIFNSADD